MPLSRYASQCRSFAVELFDSMTDKDVELLREDLASLEAGDWLDWVEAHHSDIVAFVRATPTKRLKRIPWQDSHLRRRLVLAAIRHVQCAEALMNGIVDHQMVPGGSYRDMAAIAGIAYEDICLRNRPQYWPFAGEIPFRRSGS